MSVLSAALFLVGVGLALPTSVVLSSGRAGVPDALTFLLGLALLPSSAVLGTVRPGGPT